MARHSPLACSGVGLQLVRRCSVAAILAASAASPLIAAAEGKPIVPRATIALFNGRDLTNFYTWLGVAGSPEQSRPFHGRADPDRVFSVVDQIDGAPAIRISGQHWGGLVTTESYANYRLVAEYRWGLCTWAQRKNSTRDSGVLLHCQGEDGNYKADFRGAFMRSVEYQIIEGGTGDLILVGGHERGSPERLQASLKSTAVPAGKLLLWNPEGQPVQLGKGGTASRVQWRKKDPEAKSVTGFRGRWDVEKPVGEWNRLEAICRNGDVAFFLNGEQVNGGTGGSFREGKILFQSEGAEIYFRKIELQPLDR
jgi:hypothetical protein